MEKFRASPAPTLTKRLGLIRAFVDQADREGLAGQVYFRTQKEFRPVLSEFNRRRKELTQISHGTGSDAMSRTILREILGLIPESPQRIITPLPMVDDPTAMENL